MNRQLIDPLLQPFELKNLTLRNRVVSTSHEPSYTEDGMPKERYRLYHEEKAKGGIGLTMMGGSAVVAPDSPAAFGNLHIYKDEIVPWLRELAYGVHEHGAAVMCQITHLGRRTSNYEGDWLPVVYPSPLRDPRTEPSRRWPRNGTWTASCGPTPTPLPDAARPAWMGSRSRPTPTCSMRSGPR
jgi:2,4-dienoyl-CoA reductase-like NADH-dependent reductase (Old Yellow Enzyme family)